MVYDFGTYSRVLGELVSPHRPHESIPCIYSEITVERPGILFVCKVSTTKNVTETAITLGVPHHALIQRHDQAGLDRVYEFLSLCKTTLFMLVVVTGRRIEHIGWPHLLWIRKRVVTSGCLNR